jgi:bifunctional ADP-heptose synthase (sugar kinase/adenylyltransferase)
MSRLAKRGTSSDEGMTPTLLLGFDYVTGQATVLIFDKSQRNTVDNLLSKMAGQRILVLDDVMLDEDIVGSFLGGARESRLAVVLRREHRQMPGGAASAAVNAAGLGAHVAVVGLIGADEPGNRLCRELTARGIGGEGPHIESIRSTTKTTVVSTDRRYRLDHESSPLRRPLGRKPVEAQIAL